MDIDALIQKLLQEPLCGDDDSVVSFTNKSISLIHDIANECQTLPIIQATKDQAEEYAKDMTAEEIYVDMLVKIVEAPTHLHMILSARMLIPIIDRKLKERGL